MRIFIDTNILISAALNPKGTPYQAFLKAVTHPNKGIICDKNIEELGRIFNQKFPTKLDLLEQFISIALLSIEIVPISDEKIDEEKQIRDIDDRPILRAAIKANSDILITGDKDFLESGIEHPKILNASEFLEVPL